ncbi:MAG: hypothetical protein SWX82_03925 [Cyanobacteriota bacterium]|nr:hypothetical protein [Cyanobacteriota bacterium]
MSASTVNLSISPTPLLPYSPTPLLPRSPTILIISIQPDMILRSAQPNIFGELLKSPLQK